MDAQRLADDLADAHARVERGVGVLENDLHLAAHFAQRRRRQRGKLLAPERDRSRSGLDQMHHTPAQRCLAAAGFADEPERLTRLDRERHTVDRLDISAGATEQTVPHRVVLFQVADFEQGHLRHLETSHRVTGGNFDQRRFGLRA